MSAGAAFTALYALRCEGVDADRHYGIGVLVPRLTDEPTIYWQYAPHDSWSFASEAYDLQAGALLVGVRMTLLVNRYLGDAQREQLMAVPGWADRLLAMLGGDMLLGDTLTEPLAAYMRRVGVITGLRGKYVGVEMDLRLSVRIEAP